MDLTLILTEDCNLRCRYCYQPRYVDHAMPPAVGIAAVRRALAERPDHLPITFFGGEPTLRADALFEILEAAQALAREAALPLTAKVCTNGLRLDDHFLARAAKTGLFVSLSHDGVPEAQNDRCLPDGSPSAAVADAALARLAKWGKPFAVYSVITPRNAGHLAASRRYLFDRGARIMVGGLDYTAAWDEKAIRTLKRQYKKLGDFYTKLLQRKEYTHFEPFDSRIAQHTRAQAFKVCAPGLRQLTVAPDGALYGCIEYFHRRAHPLGTVETWLDPAAVRALSAERSSRPGPCGECGVRNRCVNRCACVNLRATGHAAEPPEALCRLEQETIFSVDELGTRLYRKKMPEFLVRHYSCSCSVLNGVEAYLDALEEASHARV